jgi:hypothetical protein
MIHPYQGVVGLVGHNAFSTTGGAPVLTHFHLFDDHSDAIGFTDLS